MIGAAAERRSVFGITVAIDDVVTAGTGVVDAANWVAAATAVVWI